MAPNKPQVNPESRYSISETCQFLGIHRHTLRAWTLDGKIKCIFRRTNGRPAYKGVDIMACWSAVM